MQVKLNPITGLFDVVLTPLSKSDFVKAILLDSDTTITFPVASILFDEDSILFNDDEAVS